MYTHVLPGPTFGNCFTARATGIIGSVTSDSSSVVAEGAPALAAAGEAEAAAAGAAAGAAGAVGGSAWQGVKRVEKKSRRLAYCKFGICLLIFC